MGYMHINNLYKDQDILLFRECYALEKIHGTSANISYNPEEHKIRYFSGGSKHETFVKLFNEEALLEKCKELFQDKVTIYGEAYGGKIQGMKSTYGEEQRFVAFEVKIGDNFLNVPNAEEIVLKLGLKFVSYVKIKTDLKEIDAQRDRPSVQAVINGCGTDKIREGIVLRPLIEVKKNNGARVICKHKRKEFMETKTPREVNPAKLKILEEAKAIAEEWVSPMRLDHVLDKIDGELSMQLISTIIKNMKEDIKREAEGEIVWTPEAERAIGTKTALLAKERIQKVETK